MSRARGFFPVALASVFGVATAIATLNPAFKEQQRKKLEEAQAQDSSSSGSAQDGDAIRSVPLINAAASLPAGDNSLEEPSASYTTKSRLWSLLGFWAWERNSANQKEATAQSDSDQLTHDSKHSLHPQLKS